MTWVWDGTQNELVVENVAGVLVVAGAGSLVETGTGLLVVTASGWLVVTAADLLVVIAAGELLLAAAGWVVELDVAAGWAVLLGASGLEDWRFVDNFGPIHGPMKMKELRWCSRLKSWL